MDAARADLVSLWLDIQIEQSRKLSREFHEFFISTRRFGLSRREEKPALAGKELADSGAKVMPPSLPNC